MNKKIDFYPAREFKDNAIIDASKGEIFAQVEDILIDPERLAAAALVTSKGGLLSRELKAVPGDKVQVWGKDVILVSGPGAIVDKVELPRSENWLSVYENLVDRDVVSEDGKRVGTLQDVLIDTEGQVVSYQLDRIGYALDEVLVEGEGPEPNRISAKATRSLGPDVLVVNTKRAE